VELTTESKARPTVLLENLLQRGIKGGSTSDAMVAPVVDERDIQEDLDVIDRDEIDATSKLLGVHTSDVQRDYLYGWLLSGLYGDNPLMRDRLVLKGG
jgi:hypothetical protein